MCFQFFKCISACACILLLSSIFFSQCCMCCKIISLAFVLFWASVATIFLLLDVLFFFPSTAVLLHNTNTVEFHQIFLSRAFYTWCRLSNNFWMFSLAVAQKQTVEEVWTTSNNEWIKWDLSGLLNICHIVSGRKWICGLISVIILQVCAREDSIFIWHHQEICYFACLYGCYAANDCTICIHIWKWFQTTFLCVLTCVLCRSNLSISAVRF